MTRSFRVLALAKFLMKAAASSPHLPPTSIANLPGGRAGLSFFFVFCVRTIRNGHVMFPLPTRSPIEGPPLQYEVSQSCIASNALHISRWARRTVFQAVDKNIFWCDNCVHNRKREVVRCNAYFHGCLRGRSSQNVCT